MSRLTFAPLPDFERHAVTPHPDGKAWPKACSGCAARRWDPQGLGESYQEDVMIPRADTHFYCVHREDGEYHRVCACYAAFCAAEARS